MTASTSQMRSWWSPACNSGGMDTISFGDWGARITVDSDTIPIWRAIEAIFKKYHYGIRRSDTGAYNCRQITGGSGYSLHAYGIAVDINWQSNPYSSRLITNFPAGAIREIEALRAAGQPVIRWGGRYSSYKDAMHFEVIVPPSIARQFRYAAQEDLSIVDAATRRYLDTQFEEIDAKFTRRKEAEDADRQRAQRIEDKLDRLLNRR
jgi:D-alanyl-D-alanine carboxypeptidase